MGSLSYFLLGIKKDLVYVRSLGKFREAEAIEAQMKMKGVTNVENGALLASAQAAIF